MVLEKQLISAEMFLDYVDQIDDRLVELVEGVIVDMSRPGWEHGEILMLVAARIFQHAREHDLGRVAVGDTGFILERREDGKDTVRGLDLAFINKAKASEHVSSGWTSVAPDLAVEVISPSNEAASIRLKVLQLLNAGTSSVWVIYPDSRIVDVYSASGAKTLHENDTLSGGDVLPGFQMRVGDIFPS